MKVLMLIVLICIFIMPGAGLSDEKQSDQTGNDPADYGQQPLEEQNPFLSMIGEFYSFHAFSTRIVLGIVLRPDLQKETAFSEQANIVQEWMDYNPVLEKNFPLLNDAVKGFIQTPRVLSISIEF